MPSILTKLLTKQHSAILPSVINQLKQFVWKGIRTHDLSDTITISDRDLPQLVIVPSGTC